MEEKYLNIDRILNSALLPTGWLNTLQLQELFIHRLDELKISKNQALKIMNIETKSFDAFMKGTSPKIDYLTVLKLSELLDIPPSVFIDKFILQIKEENNNELEQTKVRHFIAKHFDLEGLKKIGFIDTVNDFEHIEKRILEFFGYDSIFQYKSNVDVPVYSSGKITSNKESQTFWANMAYASFDKIPNKVEYDRDALVKLFPTLRAYSLNMEHGLTQVMRILFKVGVTVIFIPKIYKDLHIRAATFCINDKPCIALTNYRDFYPTLWFALFHELYHVLYDWSEIVESEGQSHLSAGISTASIDEDAANDFARRYLLDDEKMKSIEPYINDSSYVKSFARSHNIHESIVYAIYGYTNNVFGKYKTSIQSAKAALNELNPTQYELYKPIPQIAKTTISLIN